MKILIMSDLHIEHRPRWSLPDVLSEHDVVVLAGDIHSPPAEGVRWAFENFAPTPVILVAGNHEFYGGGDIQRRMFDASVACMGLDSVHLLGRDSVVIGGVRFLGCTLWTDFDLFGPRHRDLCMARAASSINDFRLIRNFSPTDALAEHEADIGFLRRELAESFDGPTVVVTHHAPHPFSIDDRFKSDLTSAAFASDLTEIIEQHGPALWVHGHMHNSSDYAVGSTRIVCNPKGYGPHAYGAQHENGAFCMKLVEV